MTNPVQIRGEGDSEADELRRKLNLADEYLEFIQTWAHITANFPLREYMRQAREQIR